MGKMHDPFDPHQALNETTFAIFDVETTGLSPAYGHRVCEVGCLRARGGIALERFESLLDPGRPISPGAFHVNRITPDMLRGAPTFDAVAAPLLRVMEGAVLVAHNAPFDLGFLAAELDIARRPRPENPVVDTLALARRAYNFARNSLSAVAAALGVESTPTHRAMGDVQTTFDVLQRILRDLARRRGITTLGGLIEFQGGPVPYPHSTRLSSSQAHALPLPPTHALPLPPAHALPLPPAHALPLPPTHALPLPPTISDALASSGRVRVRYVDASGQETDRIVRPLRVNARGGNLYLIAHCYHRDQLRTFRLDRVLEMALED